jgi:hypothetical protein
MVPITDSSLGGELWCFFTKTIATSANRTNCSKTFMLKKIQLAKKHLNLPFHLPL